MNFMNILSVLLDNIIEIFNGIEHVLNPGDEVVVPKGTPHHGKCIAGTRTIHAFGGKRIQND